MVGGGDDVFDVTVVTFDDVIDNRLLDVSGRFGEIDDRTVLVVLIGGGAARDDEPSAAGAAAKTAPACSTFHLDDDEPIEEQTADERVLARKEHVRIAEDAVLEDEQHPEDEKRSVLHADGDDDAVDIRDAAAIFAASAAAVAAAGRIAMRRRGRRRRRRQNGRTPDRVEAGFVLANLVGGHDERELEQTPRPDRQDDDAQIVVVFHLKNSAIKDIVN